MDRQFAGCKEFPEFTFWSGRQPAAGRTTRSDRRQGSRVARSGMVIPPKDFAAIALWDGARRPVPDRNPASSAPRGAANAGHEAWVIWGPYLGSRNAPRRD